MKKGTFLILIMMVWWMALLIWSFFGWWSNEAKIIESEVPQSSDTWFVNDLTNTWNVENPTPTGDIQDSNTTGIESGSTSQTDYTQIRLMMPRYFYTPARRDFSKDLFSWDNVHINFIFIDDLNQYRDSLSNPEFSDADIILYPYDWHEFVNIQNFSFKKSLKSAFDDFVSNIIEGTETSFLPFSADPMMMYILSWYSLDNFSNISKFANDWQPPKPMSFPIFLGVSDEDYYDKWFSREYQDIMRYSLLHYFTTYRNQTNQEILSSLINSNIFEYYNVSDLNSVLNLITAPECKYFPAICFQIYGFAWIRFGFLSDADIVKSYFEQRVSKFNELQKQNFPFYQTEVPVRIRWRSIPNSLTDKKTTNAVYRFLVKYMNSGSQYDLRNSTIPTFKAEEWHWIIDNPRIWFRWYALTSWWDFLEKLKSTRAFRQLLDYEITAQEYFKRI